MCESRGGRLQLEVTDIYITFGVNAVLFCNNVGYHGASWFNISPTVLKYFEYSLTLSYPGGVKYAPLLFFVHHPKTAQGITLKLSDFEDTLLRHILQVKPVR